MHRFAAYFQQVRATERHSEVLEFIVIVTCCAFTYLLRSYISQLLGSYLVYYWSYLVDWLVGWLVGRLVSWLVS